ncbi:MAG: ATP-binding protein, partial [Gammaproteobacteria bacterium]
YFSIRYKLILMITAACFCSLLAMGIALLIIDRSSIKSSMHDQFISIAKILADQNTASLSFDDSNAATETLEAISLESDVVLACIYNEAGKLFANYNRAGKNQCDKEIASGNTYFSSDYLHVYQDVLLDDSVIGTVYLQISLVELHKRFLKMLLVIVVLVVLASIVALLAARYLQGIISKPVLKLASIAKDISDNGNYDVVVRKETNDEIGELYGAFNGMLVQLLIRQKARDDEEKLRRQTEAQVRLLLESTAEAIYGVDKNGNCIIVNPSCLKILGYESREKFLDLNAYSKLHQDPDIVEVVPFERSKIYQVIRTGKGVHVDSEKMYKRDGTPFYAEYWVYPIKTQGDTVGAVVTFIDITDRKEVEQKLKNYQEHLEEIVEHRTEEIKLAYRELEAFSYSVSHDLRAPLRAIDGFSQILAEDYESRLDELGKDYLERIRYGAQKMSQLIDDLLTLSRAMRGDISREEIDLASEALEVMSELKASDPERVVYFDMDKDMKVNGDPTLMRVVIQNLLSNAWKYTSKKQDAHIEFRHKSDNGELVYYVKDDGTGFDMKYADKLFHAFQRLHQPEEFPGTGIGLATVQRIITRHGGKVWANSSLKQGATFYFTLPPSIS